jgi:hypothetical protein
VHVLAGGKDRDETEYWEGWSGDSLHEAYSQEQGQSGGKHDEHLAGGEHLIEGP